MKEITVLESADLIFAAMEGQHMRALTYEGYLKFNYFINTKKKNYLILQLNR